MRTTRLRLAVAAVALPLSLPTSPAFASTDTVTCATPSGTLDEFVVVCTMGNSDNHNVGRYTFIIAWTAAPCSAPRPGTVTGSVTGSHPKGAITEGTALAVLDSSSGVHDLSIGFRTDAAGHAGNFGRHVAFFQFSCVSGLMAGGQVDDVETLVAAPSKPDSSYCPASGVTGTASYSPPIGATSSTTSTLTLTMTCEGAPGSASAGTYQLVSSGVEYAGCTSGDGSGLITGSFGPSAVPVNGGWAFSRSTVHYYGFPPDGTGYLRVGTGTTAKVYQLALWLDVVAGGVCPYATGTMSGHGLLIA